ncbi:MAG: helix-turn-helix transcriptional regulator [Acidobacteriota bacterium]
MQRKALGEVEQLLLFALVALRDRAYGVEIRELIEQQTGKSLSPGAIHTGFERLQRRGLVESRLGDPTPVRGGRRKRFYRITGAGARALRDSYQRLKRMATGWLPELDRLAGAE